WGGRTRLDFLPVKLLDYRGQEAVLERDQNPFAQVVLAHLHALATRQDPAGRLHYKTQLVKGLYDRGWPAEQVRELFRLIDWMMDLPADEQQGFRQEIFQWEQERRMPYMTSIERMGRLEEIQENIATNLQIRFGAPGKRLANKVRKIDDLEQLRALFEAIVKAGNVPEVSPVFR